MNKLKKTVSILVSAAVCVSFGFAAYASMASSDADASGAVVVNGVASDNHVFSAYELFSGSTVDGYLSGIQWGRGTDGEALLSALKSDSTFGTAFSECESASDAAAIIETWSDDSDSVIAFEKVVSDYLTDASATTNEGTLLSNGKYSYTLADLEDGYYVIVDSGAGDGDADSLYITKLLGSETVEVDVKTVYPTLDKYVLRNGEEVKGTSASANETLTFELVSTIPSNLTGYDTYTYIFHDTLSDNLRFSDALNFSISAVSGSDVVYTFGTIGQELMVEVTNAMELSGDTIVITYDVLMNEDTEAGVAEENVVYLEYTHDPNDGSIGNSVLQAAYVYDFDLTIYKTDNNDEPLEGAGFALYKKNDLEEWKLVQSFEAGEDTEFSFTDLGEGDYLLSETETPSSYNSISDIEFTIEASYNEDGTIAGLYCSSDDFSVDGTSNLYGTVVNRRGTVLPGAGGIGLRIFYTIGGILLILAIILGVYSSAKKRAWKN